MRAAVGERDALLSASREALIVWGRDGNAPLSYAGADAMLESCLAGPEATDLSKALDDLADRGIGFTLPVHDKNGRAITVRGRAVGGMAAVWMELPRPAPHASRTSATFSMPCPCRSGCATRRCRSSGATARFSARPAHRTWTRRAPTSPRSRNPNAISPRRRASTRHARSQALRRRRRPSPRARLHRNADRRTGVVGTAIDVTEVAAAEARLQQHIDAHADTLDKLATAVAIFDRDQKLTFYNRAFARLWGLLGKLARHASDRRRNARPAARGPQAAGAARLSGVEARAPDALRTARRISVGRTVACAGRQDAARRGAAPSVRRADLPL